MRELFSTNQKVTGSNPVGRAREETLVNQGFFRFLGNERTPEKKTFFGEKCDFVNDLSKNAVEKSPESLMPQGFAAL